MSITSYSVVQLGATVQVTVTHDQVSSPVWLHWYVAGQYVGGGQSLRRTFFPAAGEQLRVEAIDTTDPAFDAVANAPAGYPARRELFCVRSRASGLASHRLEQQQDGGAWSAVGTVPDHGQWSFVVSTGVLEDLAEYAWRLVPVDTAGNDGTPTALAAETIVRRPDAPEFSATFDAGTSKITFAAV